MHNQQQAPPSNRKYLVKFTRFNASALFEYNAHGFLVLYELVPGEFQDPQYGYLKKAFPKTLEQMQNMISAKLPNVRITEVQPDLSFDAFYNLYNYKVGKRSRAMNNWERMSDTEKAKAIAYIPVYMRRISETGYNKKYPEFYLSAEEWNN